MNDSKQRAKTVWKVTVNVKAINDTTNIVMDYDEVKSTYTWAGAILDMTKADDLSSLKFRVEDSRGSVEIEFYEVNEKSAFFKAFTEAVATGEAE